MASSRGMFGTRERLGTRLWDNRRRWPVVSPMVPGASVGAAGTSGARNALPSPSSSSGGIVTSTLRSKVRHRALIWATLAGLSGLASAAHAQDVRITGRVVDAAEHQAIPAAAVRVTGATVGANTNDSGAFTFRVPASARSLTVRRIG